MIGRTTKILGATLGFMMAAVCAQAQDFRERTIRVNFQNTADHPIGVGLHRFADLVNEKSGKKITVRLFSAGQLGGDMATISALQGGTIDMTVLNTGVLAPVDKNTAILDFPYLFNNESEADAVVDGRAGKKSMTCWIVKV